MKHLFLIVLAFTALLIASSEPNWKLFQTKYDNFLTRLENRIKSFQKEYKKSEKDAQTCWDKSKSLLTTSIVPLISSQKLTRSFFDSVLENATVVCTETRAFNQMYIDDDYISKVSRIMKQIYREEVWKTTFKELISLLPDDYSHYTTLVEKANWPLIMEKFKILKSACQKIYKTALTKVPESKMDLKNAYTTCSNEMEKSLEYLEMDIKEKSLSKEELEHGIKWLHEECEEFDNKKFENENKTITAEFEKVKDDFKKKHYPDFISQLPLKRFEVERFPRKLDDARILYI